VKQVVLVTGLGVLASACGGDFESSSRLHDLRLIAVAADKPSAFAGDAVQLSALYYDEHERPLEWGFALCDAQASSAALDCLRAMNLNSLHVQSEPRYTLTMPALAESAERDTAQGVAVIACPGHITAGDTEGIPVVCTVDGKPLPIGDFELGVKRIFYEQSSPNHNPQVVALRMDGEDWPSDETKQVKACDRNTDDVEKCSAMLRHTLSVEVDGEGEAFVDAQGADTREQTVVQFYATGGTLEFAVRTPSTAQTRFVARAEDVGRTLTIYIVVRDSRGGVSFETRRVEVSGS
jgi:hypothetical protein